MCLTNGLAFKNDLAIGKLQNRQTLKIPSRKAVIPNVAVTYVKPLHAYKVIYYRKSFKPITNRYKNKSDNHWDVIYKFNEKACLIKKCSFIEQADVPCRGAKFRRPKIEK